MALPRRGAPMPSSGSGSRSSASSGATTGSCRRPRTSGGATSRWVPPWPASCAPPAPIVIANEADLGALAEHRRGAAAGTDDAIFLSGEVGLGGGIIAAGRPLTGVAGFGGEIGHLPVNPLAGATCRCGAVGCWETEVGEEALFVRAGRPPDGGRAAVEAIARRRRRRRRHRARRARRDRPVVGHRPRRAGQRAEPVAGRARRAPRAAPSVRRRPRSSTSSTAAPSPRPARSSRSSRRRSASMPRCSGRPSWPSNRSSPTRPAGSSTGGRIRPSDSVHQRPRGYDYHAHELADPSGNTASTGGGDPYARSPIGGTRLDCRLGPRRMWRRRR